MTAANLILCAMLGIGGHPHSRGMFLRDATERDGLRRGGIVHALRHPEIYPLIGSEKGDRSEIERVPVPAIALNIGQPTIISKANGLPVADPWLSMRINLRGELNGAAGAAGTVVADAPLPLFQVALQTDLDGAVVEPSVSARAFYRLNHYMHGTAGEIVAPTVVPATVTPFNAHIVIPFCDERMMSPEDTILDTRRYNDVTLTITTGVLGDIVTGAANVTLQNCFADIEILRLSPSVPAPAGLAKILPNFRREAPIVPAAGTTFDLQRVPSIALSRLFFFASTGSTAGVPFTGAGSNAIIDTILLASNRRVHLGGTAGGASRRTLQGANKDEYSIEAVPAGWYVHDFVKDGSIKSDLPTGNLSSLQAIQTYQGGLPATPQVSLLQYRYAKLQGREAA